MAGGDGEDTAFGGQGDDVMSGGEAQVSTVDGSDELIAGIGDDTVYGNVGDDVCSESEQRRFTRWSGQRHSVWRPERRHAERRRRQ
jgi:Ca2+-binding RTX toxin-like protein